MTYGTALKHAGIKVTKMDEYETYDFVGETPNGKTFQLYKACGAYGSKFTLYIGGERKATACLFRTAIKIIKSN